jgi:hypothetical protein
MSAPCRVPIEIRAVGGNAPRVFHLVHAVAPRRLELGAALPDDVDWLHGALVVRFHLPGDAVAIVCHAHARELVFDEGTEQERAALAALDLEGLPPDAALRIEAYVEERLLQA